MPSSDEVQVDAGTATLAGNLAIPPGAKGVVEGKTGTVGFPIRVEAAVFCGRAYQDFLYIAPAQIGICLQHQRHNSGKNWRGG